MLHQLYSAFLKFDFNIASQNVNAVQIVWHHYPEKKVYQWNILDYFDILENKVLALVVTRSQLIDTIK